jgi:hypothetical protein
VAGFLIFRLTFKDIIIAVVRHSAQDIYTKVHREEDEAAPAAADAKTDKKPEKQAKGKKEKAEKVVAEAETTEA